MRGIERSGSERFRGGDLRRHRRRIAERRS